MGWGPCWFLACSVTREKLVGPVCWEGGKGGVSRKVVRGQATWCIQAVLQAFAWRLEGETKTHVGTRQVMQ